MGTTPVQVAKEERPPFEDSEKLKLLNAIKVCHVPIDDPNIALYIREVKDTLYCYFKKQPELSTIEEEKVLYVYLGEV